MGLIFGLQRRLTALLTDAIPHVTVQVPEGKPILYADLPGRAADEVVIDYELAKDLNVGVGDRIRITSVSGIPEPLRIAGVYSQGQGRGSAYVTLRTGQSMLAIGNSVNVV